MFIGDWMERGERYWPEALAVAVIPNTGHSPFIEEPDKFASLLEAYLSGR